MNRFLTKKIIHILAILTLMKNSNAPMHADILSPTGAKKTQTNLNEAVSQARSAVIWQLQQKFKWNCIKLHLTLQFSPVRC